MKIRTSYSPLALFTCQRDDARHLAEGVHRLQPIDCTVRQRDQIPTLTVRAVSAPRDSTQRPRAAYHYAGSKGASTKETS
jgi:hypothetical protein